MKSNKNNLHYSDNFIELAIIRALIFALLVAGLLALNSCASPQKIAQKAMVNPVAFNIVGPAWLSLNPCINDSVFKHTIDTVTHYDTSIQFIDKSVVMHDTIASTGKVKTIYITKTLYITDSFKVVVIDDLLLNMQKDTTDKFKALYTGSLKENNRLKERLTQQTKETSKQRWHFWLLLIGTGIWLNRHRIIALLNPVKPIPF